MNSSERRRLEEIVKEFAEIGWENLQGSPKTINHYRHIFLEAKTGNSVSLECEYVKGKTISEFK